MPLVLKNALMLSENQKFCDVDLQIMNALGKTTWKVWAFVIGLNAVGFFGAMYLQSKGINVFAIRGGS